MSRAAAAAPASQVSLSADDARLITLRAQGLTGTEGSRGGVPGMLRRLGAVQLDTISVLARSHELVAYARLGAVPRARIERAYWAKRPARPTRRRVRVLVARGLRAADRGVALLRVPPPRAARPPASAGTTANEKACAEVLARLRAEGPLTATQLGGAKKGGPWWDWSETKIAVEWLLDTGEVICVRRDGWRRVYDLPERVLPADLLGDGKPDRRRVPGQQLVATAGPGAGRGHPRRPARLPAAPASWPACRR